MEATPEHFFYTVLNALDYFEAFLQILPVDRDLGLAHIVALFLDFSAFGRRSSFILYS